MSPEQARGQAVDRRTDILAFGYVLHEMLTGRAFVRETTDKLAATLEREPDWNALPKTTRSTGRRWKRCLEKDAKRRLRDIADAHIEIDDDLVPDASSAAGIEGRPRVGVQALEPSP